MMLINKKKLILNQFNNAIKSLIYSKNRYQKFNYPNIVK